MRSEKMESWFFERMEWLHEPLGRLTTKKTEKEHMSKGRNENGDVTMGQKGMEMPTNNMRATLFPNI